MNKTDEESQRINMVQPKSNLTKKRLYTLKEAAAYLGRSEWSMRELIWAGQIPVVRHPGGRKIFVDIIDLESYIEKNRGFYH